MEIKDFSDAGIAQIAIDIEARGMAFYASVAKKFDDAKVKQIFMKLAEEEKEHREVFRKILEESETEKTFFDENAKKYLKSIIMTTIFPSPDNEEKVVGNITNPKEAVAMGIQAEKDAILLYTEMYNKIKNEEAKQVLNKLLEEEKIHLVDLRDYMEELM